MGEQEQAAGPATGRARIEAARENLREALLKLATAQHHGADTGASGAGRGTEAGQTAPSGQ